MDAEPDGMEIEDWKPVLPIIDSNNSAGQKLGEIELTNIDSSEDASDIEMKFDPKSQPSIETNEQIPMESENSNEVILGKVIKKEVMDFVDFNDVANDTIVMEPVKIETIENIPETSYKCEFCHEGFISIGMLKIHVNLVHENVKIKTCESTNVNLFIHENCFVRIDELYFPLQKKVSIIKAEIPQDLMDSYHCDLLGKILSSI